MRKFGFVLIALVLVFSLVACTRSASQPPVPTTTSQGVLPNGTPSTGGGAPTEDPMILLQQFATQTAQAQAAAAEAQAKMQIEGAKIQQKGQADMQRLALDQEKAARDHQHRMAQIEQARYATDMQALTADRDRVAQMGMHEDQTMADLLQVIASLRSGERNNQRQMQFKAQQDKQKQKAASKA